MDGKNTGSLGATEATAPSARAHHAGDGGAVAGPGRRFSAKRKLAAVELAEAAIAIAVIRMCGAIWRVGSKVSAFVPS